MLPVAEMKVLLMSLTIAHTHIHQLKCETGTPHCIPRQLELSTHRLWCIAVTPPEGLMVPAARTGSYRQRLPECCNPHGPW